MKSFSIGDALSFAWQKTKENLGLLIGSFFTIIAVVVLLDLMAEAIYEKSYAFWLFLQIASVLLSSLMGIGFIVICLKIYNNEQCSYADLFSGGQYLISYMVASIVQGIMVTIGTFLFIIPGIIIGLATCLFDYALIDENLRPLEAIKRSMDLTKGVKMQLFLFFLVILLLNILGVLCFTIGVFITAPMTTLAFIYVYKELVEQENRFNFIED